MRTQYDHEYQPGDWTAEGIARALRSADESYPIPRYGDEAAWRRIRTSDVTGPLAETVLTKAEEVRDEPVPRLPASKYLDYEREGVRGSFQDPKARQIHRLSLFSLAECLEREGRYLDPVLDYAWAICEQSTWVLPAHLPDDGTVGLEGLPLPARPTENHVALHPAEMGQLLGELDYLLDDELHPALGDRIRAEVEERVLTPYEARDDFHWRDPPVNNWNAVCNAGPVIAALYLLDDPDRLGRLVVKAASSLRHYLAGFDPNGCTAEGIDYWNYGFGNYVQLAVQLAERTGGEYDLLSVPVAERIATYPLKVELSPGHYVPFSDAAEGPWPSAYLAARLGERFDKPGLVTRGRQAFAAGSALGAKGDANLRTLAWCADLPEASSTDHPRQRFLQGYDWWFARATPGDPDGLVVAAKGGHNDEPHNHNDCGSFVVYRRGESLLTDLGRPTYTGSYFGDDRYEHLAARSLGHSVPLVDGYEQAPGADRAAAVVDRSEGAAEDSITFELAECYPREAGIDSLTRTVALEGERERVHVTDEASFEGEGSLESMLISYDPMTAADGAIEIDGERSAATVVPEGSPSIRVEHLEDAIDTSGHTTANEDLHDVWRARIDAGRDETVAVALSVTF